MAGEDAPEVFNDNQPGLEPIKQQSEPPNYYGTSETPVQRSRNPFGLGPLAFGGLVALISAVIVGAAVGGGLGGTLASCNAKSTPTVTTTIYYSAPTATASSPSSIQTLVENYTPLNATLVDSLAHNCTNGDTYTSYWGQVFTKTCNVDYTSGLAASGGGVIGDIVAITAYTIEDCFNACSARNYDVQRFGNGDTCLAISWSWDLKNSTTDQGANCWLKNATLAAGKLPNSNSVSIAATVN